MFIAIHILKSRFFFWNLWWEFTMQSGSPLAPQIAGNSNSNIFTFSLKIFDLRALQLLPSSIIIQSHWTAVTQSTHWEEIGSHPLLDGSDIAITCQRDDTAAINPHSSLEGYLLDCFRALTTWHRKSKFQKFLRNEFYNSRRIVCDMALKYWKIAAQLKQNTSFQSLLCIIFIFCFIGAVWFVKFDMT